MLWQFKLGVPTYVDNSKSNGVSEISECFFLLPSRQRQYGAVKNMGVAIYLQLPLTIRV
jgi:hypothetical protein